MEIQEMVKKFFEKKMGTEEYAPVLYAKNFLETNQEKAKFLYLLYIEWAEKLKFFCTPDFDRHTGTWKEAFSYKIDTKCVACLQSQEIILRIWNNLEEFETLPFVFQTASYKRARFIPLSILKFYAESGDGEETQKALRKWKKGRFPCGGYKDEIKNLRKEIAKARRKIKENQSIMKELWS